MGTKAIFESHPVANLKKAISKTNIKGYSKMKKPELVQLMIKNRERFKDLEFYKPPPKTVKAKPPPKPVKKTIKVKKQVKPATPKPATPKPATPKPATPKPTKPSGEIYKKKFGEGRVPTKKEFLEARNNKGLTNWRFINQPYDYSEFVIEWKKQAPPKPTTPPKKTKKS